MSKPITVMLVDDHFVVRSGLAASLELEDDIEIVAEAENRDEAIEQCRAVSPQVILMDLQLPGQNGIEITRELTESGVESKVLIFSTFEREDEIRAALEAGAAGYLQKASDREELIHAIRAVADGEVYVPPSLQQRLADLEQVSKVTPREREILQCIARGKANKEIGLELGISEDTVKRHVSNILQKLDVADRAQATAEAIRRGIVRV